MTPTLEEINELGRKATARPWASGGEALMCWLDRPGQPYVGGIIADSGKHDDLGLNWGNDAAYLAAAANVADKLAAKLLAVREELGPLLRMIEEGSKLMLLTVSPKGTCSGGSEVWDEAKARELLKLLSEEA